MNIAALRGIEGVGDVIDVVAGKTRMLQAVPDRALGELMRVVSGIDALVMDEVVLTAQD